MTAAVTNDLSIIYGGTTIGGTTDYLIVGPMKLDWGNANGGSFRRAAVECTVLVTGSPYATFVANRQALEAAFSTQRQRLRVILGGTTHIDANPSTNTGFNHFATARDLGDEWDTGSSRAYVVRVECDLPSNNANALADFGVEISQTPAGRRKVAFKGAYTATGATSALAQFEAQIGTKAATFLDTLTASPITGRTGNANFEVLENDAQPDADNKICTFRRTYLETINSQAVGAFADSEIVDPHINVSVRDTAPGDSVGPNPVYSKLPKDLGPNLGIARRASEITITYDAWIANTSALKARWLSKIRPLLYQVLAAYGSGEVVPIEEDPGFQPDDNRISAKLVALAFNSKLLELEIVVQDEQDFGAAVDETWGDPYDADVAPGPARFTRIITRTSKTVGAVGLFDEIGLINPPAPPPKGWVSLGRKRRPRTKRVGFPGKYKFITDTVDVELLRYVTTPSPTNAVSDLGSQGGGSPPIAAAPPPTGTSTGSSPTPGAPTPTFSGLGINPRP